MVFRDGVAGTALATNALSGGVADFITNKLSAASHTIYAEYRGGATHAVSTNSLAQTVNKKALSVTAPTIASKVYDRTATAGAVTVGTLSGFIGSETVTATGAAANYSGTNAGSYPGVVDIRVRLQITGGYNGDLYGYIRHSSGFTILLNHIGVDEFGNAGAGMNVTFTDASGNEIHTAPDGVLSGDYNPDGSSTFSSFQGLDADGSWTLFLADTVGGDVSTLVTWGLDIEVVPEPVGWALIGFASIFLAVATVRLVFAQKKFALNLSHLNSMASEAGLQFARS